MSRMDVAGIVFVALLAVAPSATGQSAVELGDCYLQLIHKLPAHAEHPVSTTAGGDKQRQCPHATEAERLCAVFSALRDDVEMVRGLQAAGPAKLTRERLHARLQEDVASRLREALSEKDPGLRAQLITEADARLNRLKAMLASTSSEQLERLKAAAGKLKDWVDAGAPGADAAQLQDDVSALVSDPSSAWRLPLPDSTAQHQAFADPSTVDLASYLVDAHAAYKTLREVARDQARAQCGESSVGLELAKLDGSLHNAMDTAGLRSPFTGALSLATGFSRVGDGKAETASAQAALVRFESRHFKLFDVAGKDRLHFAIAGRFGINPAFTMLKPQAPSFTDVGALRVVPVDPEHTGTGDSFDLIATTDAGPLKRRCKRDAQGAFVDCEPDPVKPVAKLQPAFVWDLGLQAGIPLANRGELIGFWHGGQTFVTSNASVVAGSNPPALGLEAGASSAARFFEERGVRLVLFKDGRSPTHELSVLRPVFEIEYGWRYDKRFLNQADFKPFEKDFGTRPHRRRILRIALSGLPVFGDKDTPFSVSFAIDHEWANGTGLPGGTRVYVQGDLDLLKLFK